MTIPTKLLHTADLHLDSPLRSLALRDDRLRARVETASRAAFDRIVDAALEESVRALLIAGDLFDGRMRSARTAAHLTSAFERLGAAGVSVCLIKGNHDAENPLSGMIDWPANVHVFGGRGGSFHVEGTDIHIHGVSFRDRHAPESLLPRFPPPVPGAVNIGMLHTSLGGAAGHDVYAPCRIEDLRAHGYDYWALGHVHGRQVHGDDPWIVMPGMPQGRDIGEAGPKSATLIEVTDGGLSVSEIPTGLVQFQRLEIDLSGCRESADIRHRLRDALDRCAQALAMDEAILRVRLHGQTPLHWSMARDRAEWEEALGRLAEDTGRLWVEAVDQDISPPDADMRPADGAADELAAIIGELRASPGFLAEARATAEEVLSRLPQERRAEVMPDERALEALIARLAREGGDMLAARLRSGARAEGDGVASEDD